MKANYLIHEDKYKKLKASNFQGWGGETFSERDKEWRQSIKKLLVSKDFPKEHNIKILELGSGAGNSLMPFAELNYDVTGIDISETAINWAKENFNKHNLKGKFFSQSVVDLSNFENSSFDVVIDSACIHCIIGEDRQKLFSEVHRVLNANVFFYISHMVNDPRKLPADSIFDEISRNQIVENVSYRHMPKFEDLKLSLVNQNFKIVYEELRSRTWWDHAEIWCLKSKIAC